MKAQKGYSRVIFIILTLVIASIAFTTLRQIPFTFDRCYKAANEKGWRGGSNTALWVDSHKYVDPSKVAKSQILYCQQAVYRLPEKVAELTQQESRSRDLVLTAGPFGPYKLLRYLNPKYEMPKNFEECTQIKADLMPNKSSCTITIEDKYYNYLIEKNPNLLDEINEAKYYTTTRHNDTIKHWVVFEQEVT